MRILIYEKIKNLQILPYVGVHLRLFYAIKRTLLTFFYTIFLLKRKRKYKKMFSETAGD
jgi:hypothetical protein